MKRLLPYITLLLLLVLAIPAKATHLVGGSMSYEYKGLQSNGLYRYTITVQMYRDCQASQVAFDPQIEVGVYNNNATRTRSKIATLIKVSERSVDPPSGGSDCDFQPNTCLRQAIYQGNVDVNASTVGYHLIYQRCCRNTQANILDDQGQSYYAFIPATSIQNNSPFFTGVPAPYICKDDLVSVYNSANDLDGDSLVYKLAEPWNGGSDNDPVPTLPAVWPNLPNSLDNVIYRNGYNFLQPFGNAGQANINSTNGVTQLLAPNNGRYSIAIDVEEYRNGVLLSRIRLDIQLIVITCPPNDVPVINTSQNTFTFDVVEGNQLCFDITGNDADGDNIQLKAEGEPITGGPNFGNTATFTNKTGNGNVSSQFCWTPSCGRARTTPYLITVELQDDGCPPKRRLQTIEIVVKPFIGTTVLNGPGQVCSGTKGVVYSTTGSGGSTFDWTVTGGTIASGDGTNSITVDWFQVTQGTVQVRETNAGGCVGDPVTRTITLLPAPTPPVITGSDTVCEFSTNSNYSIPATTGFTYQWLITGGNIASGANTNSINVNWGAEGNAEIGVIQVNSLGCGSDTSFFPVYKSRSEVDSLLGSPSVCPNVPGVEYRVTNEDPTSVYSWNIVGGTQSAGGNTGTILVDWGSPTNGYVEVTEINKFGCQSDPVRVNVLVDHQLVGMVPNGEDTLCENTTGITYSVINTNGSQYFWSIQGGTITQNDSSNSVVVDWGTAGIGRITVYETSYDSVTNTPCFSDPNTLDVLLAPYPTAQNIVGPDEICQSPDSSLFTYTGYNNSTFDWSYTGPGTIHGDGNDSVFLNINTPGTFTIGLIETSQFGCIGPAVQKQLVVHPKPTTTGIFGDSIVCHPNYLNNTYSVSGFANSTFDWTLDEGSITQGQGSDAVLIDFNGNPNAKITAQETSEFGCVGDLLELDVFIDSPWIDMKVISVNLEDDSKMEISWELGNAPLYDSDFFIERRNAGTINWFTTATLDQTEDFYIDPGLNTDETIYEYRVSGLNLCKDSIHSEVHRNVQITGRRQEDDKYAINLFWTIYSGWDNGITNYEVHRINGNAPRQLINTLTNDTFDFYDDGMEAFRHCYRIKTIENGTEISWSNEICFDFDPILFVPNAFTANGDGLNDKYDVVYASIKSYKIDIYDRWGEKVFTSTDPSQSWDGTYKGTKAPEGVYMYIIRYAGADDRNINLKGNVTLLR